MDRSTSFMHVLIIDDDPIFVQILKAFFQSIGVGKISMAPNGRSAQSILTGDDTPVDFITCDIFMPDFDGIEMIQALKAVGSKIPLLIISSASPTIVTAAETLAKAHELNFIGRLGKPIDMPSLETAIARQLHQQVVKPLVGGGPGFAVIGLQGGFHGLQGALPLFILCLGEPARCRVPRGV